MMSAEASHTSTVESVVLNVDVERLRDRRMGERAVLLPSGAVGSPSFLVLERDEVMPDRIVLHTDGRADRVWQRNGDANFRLVRGSDSRGYVTAEHDSASPHARSAAPSGAA